jgi:hypothetical protein
MAAGRIKAPEVLEELESHLRDDVEQQVRSGVDQRPAFDAAVQRIGPRQALKKEFCKVSHRGAWGFRDNPLALNFLAVWLVVMGLKNLQLRFLLLNMLNGFGLAHYSAGQIVFASLSIVLGIGLLCHRNFWRVCAIAFFALHITGTVGFIAAHGLSASVYAYAPHILAPGVEYDVLGGLLPVPYPVLYAVLLFNSAMWFFGLFLLTRPSIRNLFRTVSA